MHAKFSQESDNEISTQTLFDAEIETSVSPKASIELNRKRRYIADCNESDQETENSSFKDNKIKRSQSIIDKLNHKPRFDFDSVDRISSLIKSISLYGFKEDTSITKNTCMSKSKIQKSKTFHNFQFSINCKKSSSTSKQTYVSQSQCSADEIKNEEETDDDMLIYALNSYESKIANK